MIKREKDYLITLDSLYIGRLIEKSKDIDYVTGVNIISTLRIRIEKAKEIDYLTRVHPISTVV